MELNITRQITTLRAMAKINRTIQQSAESRYDTLIAQNAKQVAECFEKKAQKLEIREATKDASFLFSLAIMLSVLSAISVFIH